jgi:DNA-binding PucR family transcriptional regulator
VEDRVQARFGREGAVVSMKEGLLVSIFPVSEEASDPAAGFERFLFELRAGEWWIGVGGESPGVAGVARSYREAREALDLGQRLGLQERIVRADTVRPFRLLARDPDELDEVVHEVLGRLEAGRGGSAHLIETLEALFSEGGNVSAAARRLHVTPRAVTYRLETVRRLTGYRADDARDAFVLQLALWGRRLRSAVPAADRT